MTTPTLSKVYVTFYLEDRTIARVFASHQGAIDHQVRLFHEWRGGAGLPIAEWDREQMERLARNHVAVEDLHP